MNIEFVKMEGTGNDFVIVDNRRYGFAHKQLAALAQSVCPRRTGVGADGLLVFADPDGDEADYRMRYLNRDGSVASMCGNGARCLALYARREAGLPKGELRFESDAGTYRARVPADSEEGSDVRLYVDPPRRFEMDLSLETGTEMREAGLGPFHYIWPGVEHVVCFVEELESLPVTERGRIVRHDATLAPAGANVNFAQALPGGGLRVRTYEKGVEAETPACGTGALASAGVARLLGVAKTWPVRVEMPGGCLAVGGKLEDDRISEWYLEGPARFVFRGEMVVDG